MEKELEKIFLEGLEQNKNKLFRICSAYSIDSESTKDLFQEAIINIWQSIHSFKSQSNISTWMFRITLNVCLRIQYSQKKRRILFKNMDSILIENLHFTSEKEESNKKLVHLRHCISQLKEPDKSIITLCLEELSYKQISEVTGLTENHIAVKVKRIRSKLFICINQK